VSGREVSEESEKTRRVAVVNKKHAAIFQLEAAIWLWFRWPEPISIHTLAVASNECFNALAGRKKQPSILQQWIKAQPQAIQKRIRKIQNFFKHGLMDLTGEVRLPPLLSEITMFDSVICCKIAFSAITPLMCLYGARFSLEHTDILQRDFRPYFLEGIQINDLGDTSRAEFFVKLLPVFERFVTTTL
jgi:hypothetical protein